MASIQKRTETVVKKFVRLDLDEDEAKFLADLLACVGGNRESRRRHAEELADLLKKEGFDHGSWEHGHYVRIKDMSGSVIMS